MTAIRHPAHAPVQRIITEQVQTLVVDKLQHIDSSLKSLQFTFFVLELCLLAHLVAATVARHLPLCAAGIATREEPRAAARGWLQNATRTVPLGRYMHVSCHACLPASCGFAFTACSVTSISHAIYYTVDYSSTLLQHHPILDTLQLKRTMCFDCPLHTEMASGRPPPPSFSPASVYCPSGCCCIT